jgi:HAE1 family hydrophobic/amphiphilic exporter-1
MVFVAMLVLGVIAYSRIPLQLLPSDLSHPFIFIYISFPNANPSEVEKQITEPLEEVLSTVGNLKKLRTVSEANGARLYIEFQAGTQMDVAYTEVRDKIDRVRSGAGSAGQGFPDEVERIFIRKFNPTNQPIAYIGVTYEEEISDPHHILEHRIRKRLERMKGIAKVDILGAWEKEIAVDLAMDRLKARGVGFYHMVQGLKKASFNMPSGYIYHLGKKYYVRSVAKFGDIVEIEEYRLPEGAKVREIADVSYAVQSVDYLNRINRRYAAALLVFKESLANTVEVGDAMERLLSEDFPKDPKLRGFAFYTLFSQGEVIRESLDNLRDTALWGALFAVCVLLFFLRRFGLTLFITLAIPISILITIIIMFFTGDSLNLLTMMGIMLSVGMLVDNSVVVVENIYRRRELGESPEKAALYGSSEVFRAILTATLTTIIVFLPLILMKSRFQIFMRSLGMPVCYSLLASLFVATVFIPLATSKTRGRSARKGSRIIAGARRLYLAILSWALRHRLEAALVIAATMASTYYPYTHLKKTLQSQGSARQMRLKFEFPSHYDLKAAEAYLDRLEAGLEEKREELGIQNFATRFRSSRAWVRIFFKSADELEVDTAESIEKIKESIPVAPGVRWNAGWHQEQEESFQISIRILGRDTGVLEGIADEVTRRISGLPSVVSVERDDIEGSPELHVRPDRERIAELGMRPGMVAGSVSWALRGTRLPKVQIEDREVDIFVRIRPEDLTQRHQLENLPLRTASGVEVPLKRVASIKESRGLGRIVRENRKTILSVQATTTSDDLEKAYREVGERLKDLQLPRGYRWEMGESFKNLREAEENQMFSLVLSILFVFLLMGVLFESFTLPFSILLSIPFAFFGVYWTLYLSDTSLDIMAGIGVIILIGIVVNNAIVLIDCVNQARLSGLERHAAILQAGQNRFRPILMTALTTIFGLLPMAIGRSGIAGVSYSPLGRTVMGGLAASTLLTLFVVPLFYTFFDDLQEAALRLFRLGFGRESSHP